MDEVENKPEGDKKEFEKIKIGWFSYSCCEDSTIVFTELLNDHWKEWKELFDFKHIKVLQSHNEMCDFDVAFIEGAATSQEHVDKMKEIRGLSKYVVAVGACACMGMPSAMRNTFDEEKQKEVQFLIDRFKMLPKVQKVGDVIKVDAEVPGCPMNPDDFVAKVEGLVKTILAEREAEATQ